VATTTPVTAPAAPEVVMADDSLPEAVPMEVGGESKRKREFVFEPTMGDDDEPDLRTDGDRCAADMSSNADMRTADETTESLSYLLRRGAVHSVTSEPLPQQEVKARTLGQPPQPLALRDGCAPEKLEALGANYSLRATVQCEEALGAIVTKTLRLFGETPGIEESTVPAVPHEEAVSEDTRATPGEALCERIEPVSVHEGARCEAVEPTSEAIVVWQPSYDSTRLSGAVPVEEAMPCDELNVVEQVWDALAGHVLDAATRAALNYFTEESHAQMIRRCVREAVQRCGDVDEGCHRCHGGGRGPCELTRECVERTISQCLTQSLQVPAAHYFSWPQPIRVQLERSVCRWTDSLKAVTNST
jgi:hypothetical protein